MEISKSLNYNFDNSLSRIDETLSNTEPYDEVAEIPSRDDLTYSNGFYVDCYALFVDIRDSSQLPQLHQKRVLAKIYRSYISELTAIMQSFDTCREINIVGDCVSGIFACTGEDQVMNPFRAAYNINGIVKVLNTRLQKRGYTPIRIGIGIAKGKALMVQAGYKGSGINDVVWMGDVVNLASNLCNLANKNGNSVINVSEVVYNELQGYKGYNNEPYQNMLHKPFGKDYYTGNIIRHSMDEWVKQNG